MSIFHERITKQYTSNIIIIVIIIYPKPLVHQS